MDHINNFEKFIEWFESETWIVNDTSVRMTVAQLNLTYRSKQHRYRGTIRLKHSVPVIASPGWAHKNFGWETLTSSRDFSVHDVDFYLEEWPGLAKMTTLLLLTPGIIRFAYYGNHNFDNCYFYGDYPKERITFTTLPV